MFTNTVLVERSSASHPTAYSCMQQPPIPPPSLMLDMHQITKHLLAGAKNTSPSQHGFRNLMHIIKELRARVRSAKIIQSDMKIASAGRSFNNFTIYCFHLQFLPACQIITYLIRSNIVPAIKAPLRGRYCRNRELGWARLSGQTTALPPCPRRGGGAARLPPAANTLRTRPFTQSVWTLPVDANRHSI